MCHTFANVGSPLMWLGCAHLLILNAVIGTVEAACLAKWLGVQFKAALPRMIAANYGSGLVGYYLLPLARYSFDAWPGETPALYLIGPVLLSSFLIALVLTILIEVPVVFRISRELQCTRARKLAAGVGAQLVTYAAMAVLYVTVSSATVITDCERVRDASVIVPQSDARVLYINERDGWVWSCGLNGHGKQRVVDLAEIPDSVRRAGLWLQRTGSGEVDLMLGWADQSVVLKRLSGEDGDRGTNQSDRGPAEHWPIDFRPLAERVDTCTADFIREGGLTCQTRTSDGSYAYDFRISLATPLITWGAGYPTIMPDGVVVFEFGRQIMIKDGHRRIAAIAWGTSPVVVMPTRAAAIPAPQ